MTYSRVTNPSYPEATEYPYIRGAIYTRPTFGEETQQDLFRLQPIIKMPSMMGMGDEQPAQMTGAAVCENIKDIPAAYAKCVKFNEDMAAPLQKFPGDALTWQAKIATANSKCGEKGSDMQAWATCYYDSLTAPWYKSPLWLGLATLATVMIAGAIWGERAGRE